MQVARHIPGAFTSRQLHVVAQRLSIGGNGLHGCSSGTRPTKAESHEVPVPLCRRPPQYIEHLGDVLDFKKFVLQRIEEIGDVYSTDGGPTAADLKRELDWTLDDAVAAVRVHPSTFLTDTTWRELEVELHVAQRSSGSAVEQWQLQLRAPLMALEDMWRQRGGFPFSTSSTQPTGETTFSVWGLEC